jgi:hypothetical protein
MILLLGLLLIGTVQAQERTRTPNPEMNGAFKELMQSVRTYVQANVLPQLRTWKSQLDGAMSPEDLKALNDLRARATELRKQRIAAAMAMREAWKREDYTAVKTHRDRMKEIGGDMKELLPAVRPIAREYRSTLEELGAAAKPFIENWKSEGKELFIQWYQTHKDEIGDRPFPRLHGKFGHFGKKMTVARFMLWDGGDFMQEMEHLTPENGAEIPFLE